MRHIIIFSTAPSEKEAARIAKALVGKKLVACVNMVPKLRSIYRWKGKIFDEPEVLMIMKSQKKLFGQIKKELKKLHSYECPESIAMDIADGLPDYLKWIYDSTR
ncbi:MAG: divalent-cation tolerance protein CutA [Deltaproteobacteria bacterium CG11_big_fil_rev_8_21_14_0_20_49_13]|nr:MAG: divalent-cation tolerance protein CutA [Deltaproteobacteria bacterium CG11_big_fil_rev_8_21_14_0_20_49_13]